MHTAQTLAYLATLLAFSSSTPIESYHQCSGVGANVAIELPNVYPESGDFDPYTCDMYISSTGNNSLVVYQTRSRTSKAIELPGISHNDEYLLDGIDFDRYSGDLFISAGARPAFFTNGANLTGPSVLIRYDPRRERIVWMSNITTLVADLEQELGYPIGGFQDQAEDRHGNSYYMATWGNVLVKVNPHGQASSFYVPSTPTPAGSPGFGGLFTQGHYLVISDAISEGFAVFDLQHESPQPLQTRPSNVPTWYKPGLCDSLYAPQRYQGRVVLCADDFVNGTGGIVAYVAHESWRSFEYVGILPNNFAEAPHGTTTATFEASEYIYAVIAYLPGADGSIGSTKNFPIIDVTSRIDSIVCPYLERARVGTSCCDWKQSKALS